MNRCEAGRRRLALRLPQMRSRIMTAKLSWQLDLFEAYQMAVEARENMREDPATSGLFDEYVDTCLELERDVVRTLREGPRKA